MTWLQFAEYAGFVALAFVGSILLSIAVGKYLKWRGQ